MSALGPLRRLAWAVVVVFGVASAAFFATALLPGDPVQALMGPQASPAAVAEARRVHGLDDPLAVRYARFVGRLVHRAGAAGSHASCEPAMGLHVDLGHSFVYRQPVARLVAKKLPASFELALAAIAVQLALGLGLGSYAAARRGRTGDDAAMGLATLVAAAPAFVTALLLQHLVGYRLGWLPLDGRGASAAERLASIVLPAITLGLWGSAVLARLWRGELAEALGGEPVRAARARGASRWYAAVAHAARGALGTVAQLTVLEAGALVGGAIVTERIFRWPGLGEMTVNAVQGRDAPAIVGVTIVSAAAVVTATWVADVIAALLDPRLRSEG